MSTGVHSAVMSQHVNRAERAVFSSRASVVAGGWVHKLVVSGLAEPAEFTRRMMCATLA